MIDKILKSVMIKEQESTTVEQRLPFRELVTI